MGAFYNSICIPGQHRESVRRILERWLVFKGFELRAGPVLFDLDSEQERSIFVVSNSHWTVLFYSQYDEERRLIRELQANLGPVLYMWVQDSEAWGYDIFNQDGFAASFASDPRIYQSFADEPLATQGRPKGDASNLCQVLDLPDKLAELRRIERQRSPFKENVCGEFCRHLGMDVAASSYDDLESGLVHEMDNWQSEQMLFVLRDLTTGSSEIDLHQHSLKWLRPEVGYAPSRTVELSPEILADMKRMRRRVRLTHRLLKPVSWLARGWNGLLELTSRRTNPPSTQPRSEHNTRERDSPARPHGQFRLESTVLFNDRHLCRITLAEGVRPVTVSNKPASVFAFEVGGVTITCTARRLSKIDEVLRKPDRSKVHCNENYQVGGFPVRHLIFELPVDFVPGSQEISYLTVYVVQTPRALYVFPHRTANLLPESVRQAIRLTVDSFCLLRQPPPSPQGERKE